MHKLTPIDVNDDDKMTIDVKLTSKKVNWCHFTLDDPGTIDINKQKSKND